MDRRLFVKTGTIAGIAAAMPRYSFASAKGSDRIKVGLIGCGGRGTGAVNNMIAADQNVKIVAVADLFADKPQNAINKIAEFCEKNYPSQKSEIINPEKVKVYTGWDCVDGLLTEDIDLVIEATPPVFRTPHYEKIVAAGKHAFLEKPSCIDVTQARKMYELAKKAEEKSLCVICGTQRRYHKGYQEAMDRIHDGIIGDIVSADCYWNSTSYVGHAQHDSMEKAGLFKGLQPDDMEYQIRNWFSFIWTSGDHIVEQHVHNLDVIRWALGDDKVKPVEVRGMGGRSNNLPFPTYGDRFSHFAVDFDMGNGLHIHSYCQQDPQASGQVGERIVGTKGYAYLDLYGKIFINDFKDNIIFKPEKSPQCLVEEHKFLLDAIRAGRAVNRLALLTDSTMYAIAGRMSAFSGKKFKFDWALSKSAENLCPEKFEFGKKAITPIPVPGITPLV